MEAKDPGDGGKVEQALSLCSWAQTKDWVTFWDALGVLGQPLLLPGPRQGGGGDGTQCSTNEAESISSEQVSYGSSPGP